MLVTSDEDEAVVIHSESALKAGERRKLDVKSKKWDAALKDARAAMGTKTPSEFISLACVCRTEV